MYLFCPNCQTQFPSAGRCPRCSSRLLSPGEAVDVFSKQSVNQPRPKPTTLGGRVAVGVVLSLGLYAAFREWTLAGMTLAGENATNMAFFLGFTLRLLSAIIGGVMAGVGRESGFSGGFAVGVISGFAWLLFDPYPDLHLDFLKVGLATVIATGAGIASVLSGRIWPPAVDLPDPDPSKGSSLLSMLPPSTRKDSSRPTSLARVIISVTIVLCSLMVADKLRESMKKLPRNLISVGGPNVAAKKTFEIAVVGILIGGLIAGASTGAGLRHGIYAAVLTSIGAVAIYHTKGPNAVPALDYIIEQVQSDPKQSPLLGLFLIFFVTSTITGWLGGQMFPPLNRRKRLKPVI